VESFTEAVDLMPTVLEALGREVPDACNGRSLLPFLAGETPEDWRREAHWEYDFREVRSQAAEKALGIASEDCCLNVIRGERYKYVHFAALPPLLFDLQEDPGETRNLAGDPGHAGILLEMAQKLLSWRMRSADQELANLHLGEGGVARARRGIVKKA
jgi:arylsulfatase A-like enzyme